MNFFDAAGKIACRHLSPDGEPGEAHVFFPQALA